MPSERLWKMSDLDPAREQLRRQLRGMHVAERWQRASIPPPRAVDWTAAVHYAIWTVCGIAGAMLWAALG